jgi:hypothetical protein
MKSTGIRKKGTIIEIRMIAPRMDDNVETSILRESPSRLSMVSMSVGCNLSVPIMRDNVIAPTFRKAIHYST